MDIFNSNRPCRDWTTGSSLLLFFFFPFGWGVTFVLSDPTVPVAVIMI